MGCLNTEHRCYEKTLPTTSETYSVEHHNMTALNIEHALTGKQHRYQPYKTQAHMQDRWDTTKRRRTHWDMTPLVGLCCRSMCQPANEAPLKASCQPIPWTERVSVSALGLLHGSLEKAYPPLRGGRDT